MMDFFGAIEHARATRLLCCITFHFREARLAFLADTLRFLSEFPVASMDVVLITNSACLEHIALLRRLGKEIFPTDGVQVRTFEKLVDPRDLTWCHKAIIADEFVAENRGRYTHFIYLEDDIGLTFSNFTYFLHFRELLRDFGLLPAFVRTEYNTAMGGSVASDAFWPVYVPVQPHLLLDDLAMVNMPNPYNPCFILDRELAEGYTQSRSFDKAESLEVCRWGVAERAAMGLCLEGVPTPFQSRYVVPVSVKTDSVPAAARIRHLPNNYADDSRSPLGKIRIDSLFAGARRLDSGDWWPKREGHNRSVNEQDRYILVTCHDTIVYLDFAAKRLCHAPFGIAPLNLCLELKGSHGRLVGNDASSQADLIISVANPSGELRTLSDPAGSDLEIRSFSDGTIGIKTNELYLVADLDGLIRNNRTWCRLFEQFGLMRTDTVDGLAILQRHAWISHHDHQVVTLAPQPIYFGREPPHESSALAATHPPGVIEPRRDLVLGPARIRLVARTPQFVFDRANKADRNSPLKLFVTDFTGEQYCFSQMKP
jgi:hypothetical protein